MATALYFLIFVLRLLSPLQWFKYHKRTYFRSRLRSSLDNKLRPDFHAADTEIYLICVFLLALAMWAAGWILQHGWIQSANVAAPILLPVLRCVAFVFLAESIVWLLYYSLFRPLVERSKLNLYDEAEYFILLPLALLTQILFLSIFWQMSLQQVILLLLNLSAGPGGRMAGYSAAQAIFATLLWQSYVVIVIASLIRVLPALHVRKRPTITVIGCGDVVKNRLLPALLTVFERRQIAVAADHLTTADRRFLRAHGIENLFSALAADTPEERARTNVVEKIAMWAESRSKFAIVAVPTPFHLDYMLQLAKRELRFGLEKPIVGTEAELNLLARPSSAGLFDNAFVLSYYWLEKGLSLNYLLGLNPHYRGLLNIEPSLPVQEIAYLFERLGKLKALRVEFLEADETPERSWSEIQSNGGMTMETLVHPMTFVVNFARACCGYESSRELWAAPPHLLWKVNRERARWVRKECGQQIGPTYVEIEGRLAGDVAVQIRCGKYIVEPGMESRSLVAEFEHGSVTADMNTMETTLELAGGEEPGTTVKISNKYHLASQRLRSRRDASPIKYQSMVDLLNTFFVDGWGGMRFDDYPSQMDVLRELTKLQKTIPALDRLAGDRDA